MPDPLSTLTPLPYTHRYDWIPTDDLLLYTHSNTQLMTQKRQTPCPLHPSAPPPASPVASMSVPGSAPAPEAAAPTARCPSSTHAGCCGTDPASHSYTQPAHQHDPHAAADQPAAARAGPQGQHPHTASAAYAVRRPCLLLLLLLLGGPYWMCSPGWCWGGVGGLLQPAAAAQDHTSLTGLPPAAARQQGGGGAGGHIRGGGVWGRGVGVKH